MYLLWQSDSYHSPGSEQVSSLWTMSLIASFHLKHDFAHWCCLGVIVHSEVGFGWAYLRTLFVSHSLDIVRKWQEVSGRLLYDGHWLYRLLELAGWQGMDKKSFLIITVLIFNIVRFWWMALPSKNDPFFCKWGTICQKQGKLPFWMHAFCHNSDMASVKCQSYLPAVLMSSVVSFEDVY